MNNRSIFNQSEFIIRNCIKNTGSIASLFLATGILVFSLYFSAYQIQRYNVFDTALDTISMEQPIWNTLQGRFMRATYYPVTGWGVTDFHDRVTENKWGDHVQPILLVLLIPYMIVQRPETLMVVLSISLALGAIPLFRIANRRLGSSWLALLFAFGYLLLPAIQTNTAWDTHTTNFLPPLLLAAIDAAENRKRVWWWFWALLAMSVREDMPLLVGWMMVFLVPKDLRRQACGMLGLGAGFSLLSFTVIIPYFGGGSSTPYYIRLFPLGTVFTVDGIKETLSSWWFWSNNLYKFFYYNIRLGLPFLFIFWFYSPALFAMAPQVILNVAAWWGASLMPETYHYSALVIPIAFVGAVRAFPIVEHKLTILRPHLNWRGLLASALGASMLASQISAGYTPLTMGFVWPKSFRQTNTAQEMLALVPPDAAISAEDGLASHLGKRETLRFFPDIRAVDWILLDVWYGRYRYYLPEEETNRLMQALLSDSAWVTVRAEDGLILLQRGDGPPQDIEEAFYPGQLQTQDEINLQFGVKEDGLRLQQIQLFTYQKEGGPLLCTDWIRTGKGDLVPRIQINTSQEEFTQPLSGVKIYPNLFTGPRIYRDCTRLPASAKQGAEISLWVEYSTGTRMPVQLEQGISEIQLDYGVIRLDKDLIRLGIYPYTFVN